MLLEGEHPGSATRILVQDRECMEDGRLWIAQAQPLSAKAIRMTLKRVRPPRSVHFGPVTYRNRATTDRRSRGHPSGATSS